MALREPARVIEIPNADPAAESSVPPDMRVPGKIGAPSAADLRMNSRNPIDLPRESIASLVPPKPKVAGVEVLCAPSDRELVVKYRGNIVAVIRWLPGVQKFLIKRCQELLPNNTRSATWLQYQNGLHEAWRVCGELGVTVEEFQQSFVDMPPEIAWDMKHCPQRRTDCQLTYAGDPRLKSIPDLSCRTCGCRFSMREDGELVLMQSGEGGAVTSVGSTETLPRLSHPEVPFDRDLVRYQGMGKAKLEKLQEAGIRSWSDVVAAGAAKIAHLPGFSEKTAEMLVEIAQEKV